MVAGIESGLASGPIADAPDVRRKVIVAARTVEADAQAAVAVAVGEAAVLVVDIKLPPAVPADVPHNGVVRDHQERVWPDGVECLREHPQRVHVQRARWMEL